MFAHVCSYQACPAYLWARIVIRSGFGTPAKRRAAAGPRRAALERLFQEEGLAVQGLLPLLRATAFV